MVNHSNQPDKFDAVLGGQNLPPHDSLVLGGKEGLQKYFSQFSPTQKLANLASLHLEDDWEIDLLVVAINDSDLLVRATAYEKLQSINSLEAKNAIANSLSTPGSKEQEEITLYQLLKSHVNADPKLAIYAELTATYEFTRESRAGYDLASKADWKNDSTNWNFLYGYDKTDNNMDVWREFFADNHLVAKTLKAIAEGFNYQALDPETYQEWKQAFQNYFKGFNMGCQTLPEAALFYQIVMIHIGRCKPEIYDAAYTKWRELRKETLSHLEREKQLDTGIDAWIYYANLVIEATYYYCQPVSSE